MATRFCSRVLCLPFRLLSFSFFSFLFFLTVAQGSLSTCPPTNYHQYPRKAQYFRNLRKPRDVLGCATVEQRDSLRRFARSCC